jgi:hypothetical protein
MDPTVTPALKDTVWKQELDEHQGDSRQSVVMSNPTLSFHVFSRCITFCENSFNTNVSTPLGHLDEEILELLKGWLYQTNIATTLCSCYDQRLY